MMRIGSSDAYELPGGNEGLILHSVREHPRSRCISHRHTDWGGFERLLHGKLLV